MFGFKSARKDDAEETTGLFASLRQRLSKTRAKLSGGLADLLLGKKQIDDELLEQLEEQLLMADVGIQATRKITSQVSGLQYPDRAFLTGLSRGHTDLHSTMVIDRVVSIGHVSLQHLHRTGGLKLVGRRCSDDGIVVEARTGQGHRRRAARAAADRRDAGQHWHGVIREAADERVRAVVVRDDDVDGSRRMSR